MYFKIELRKCLQISEDDVEPGFKTENMKLNEHGQRTQFHLEIYKPTVNEAMAIWKPDGTINPITRFGPVFETGAKAPDFSLKKKVYTVATHFEEPYFMLKKDHENLRGRDKFEGYAVDLISKLSEMMNFEYEWLIVDGNGKKNPITNEWDGIIRELIDHVSMNEN